MVIGPGAGARPTRRGLLAGAAGASAAALVAACGGSSGARTTTTSSTPAAAVQTGDLAILHRALELERRTVAAYTAGIPRLTATQHLWAKQFLTQEIDHTGQVISLIKMAGGTAPDPADSYALGHPRDGDEVLALLARLEAEQIAAYLDWIPRLSSASMRATAATVLAADAQHITALRQARGRPALAGPLLGASS